MLRDNFDVTVVHCPSGGGHFSKLRRIGVDVDDPEKTETQHSCDFSYKKKDEISHVIVLIVSRIGRSLGLNDSQIRHLKNICGLP